MKNQRREFKIRRDIYINLPIKDVQQSEKFFKNLGFTFNTDYQDDSTLAMNIGENIFSMLIQEEKFKTFIKKELVDARKQTEVLLAITVENKEDVDTMVDKAISLGGDDPKKAEDHGWMYYRQFQDLDGHIWEVMWINPEGQKNE